MKSIHRKINKTVTVFNHTFRFRSTLSRFGYGIMIECDIIAPDGVSRKIIISHNEVNSVDNFVWYESPWCLKFLYDYCSEMNIRTNNLSSKGCILIELLITKDIQLHFKMFSNDVKFLKSLCEKSKKKLIKQILLKRLQKILVKKI